MSRFVLTKAARTDLDEIFDYIARDNPNAASRVLEKLRDAMWMLARNPEIGHYRRDLASEPVRFWAVYSYLVIYRAETRPLQVVRVLHASRDVRTILEEGS
jgi:plasmid stabilization system protein ParE